VTDQRHAPTREHCEAAITGLTAATLDAAERAARLCQDASVASCRSERAQLLWAADILVLLAPEVDPPVGFEMLVVERMLADPSRTRVLDDERVTPGSDGHLCQRRLGGTGEA
jgi:hypothetical protein